eukprot:CAMPEP_0119305208 /NCGR_PEP_ID=MMETSP1333-20130426/6258_1 /TAXON_ID=418940 /ORGANISM="Scyphosphaera apsteinii, Strain RCC1455" /LENGTH=319 /DNA_ID=CAMNT_0007308239 /DNA_START=38 /DNA_END=997 /DNA_ORIENTATION=-
MKVAWVGVSALRATRSGVSRLFLRDAGSPITKMWGQSLPLSTTSESNVMWRQPSVHDVSMPRTHIYAQTSHGLAFTFTLTPPVLDNLSKVRTNKERPTLNEMGSVARMMADNMDTLSESELLHREVLTGLQATLGEHHERTLSHCNSLAHVLSDQGKYEEAEKLYRQTLTHAMRTLGTQHYGTLAIQSSLGVLLHERNQLKQAEMVLRETIERCWDAFDVKIHPLALATLGDLADVLREQGKYTEARLILSNVPPTSSYEGKGYLKRKAQAARLEYESPTSHRNDGKLQLQQVVKQMTESYGSKHPLSRKYAKILDAMQ